MENFKGTKGKWVFGANTVEGILISSTHTQNRDVCTVWAYDVDFLEIQETKANALIISKAPEMLECLQSLENDNNAIPKFMWDRIQSLIKYATEL